MIIAGEITRRDIKSVAVTILRILAANLLKSRQNSCYEFQKQMEALGVNHTVVESGGGSLLLGCFFRLKGGDKWRLDIKIYRLIIGLLHLTTVSSEKQKELKNEKYIVSFINPICFIFLSSCAPTQEIKKTLLKHRLLPKKNSEDCCGPAISERYRGKRHSANQVRKAFYNHFSSKLYRDIEPSILDEKIVHLEKATGKTVLN